MAGLVVQGCFASGQGPNLGRSPSAPTPPRQPFSAPDRSSVGPPAASAHPHAKPVAQRQPFGARQRPGPPAAAGRPAQVGSQALQPQTDLSVQRTGSGEAFQLPRHVAGFSTHGGKPLPGPVREKMEAMFDASFEDVRIHVGPQAGSIGALAFTMGSNLYFAPGQFEPDTPRGQQLLGHELTHVLQQRAGRVRNPFGSGIAVVQDLALEAEADRNGRQVAMLRDPAPRNVPVQRKAVGAGSVLPMHAPQQLHSARLLAARPPLTGSDRHQHLQAVLQRMQSSTSGGKPTALKPTDMRPSALKTSPEMELGSITVHATTRPDGSVIKRRPRPYAGERVKQAMRWISTLVFQRFPSGIEVQAYFDPVDKIIIVSSNKNQTNEEIRKYLEQHKEIGNFGMLAGLIVDSEHRGSSTGRQARHRGHLHDLDYFSELQAVYKAICTNRFVVPPAVGKKLSGLHAERRIALCLEATGKTFNQAQLGGVKRPCMVCQKALSMSGHARGGFFYGGEAWKDTLRLFDSDEVAAVINEIREERRIEAKPIVWRKKDNSWRLNTKKRTPLKGVERGMLVSALKPAGIDYEELGRRLLLRHAQSNHLKGCEGLISHQSVSSSGYEFVGGEDTDSEGEDE